MPDTIQRIIDETELRCKQEQYQLRQNIKHIYESTTGQPWVDRITSTRVGIDFHPLTRRGDGDRLLVVIPETAFDMNFTDFRRAANDAIMYVRRHKMQYVGFAGYLDGFTLEDRPMAFLQEDDHGNLVGYYNVTIGDEIELMYAQGIISSERMRIK